MQKRPKVLFLSIGNSTRSQMAEGFLRNLAGDSFEAASVGTVSETPNPLAVQVMKEVGINIARQKSKSVRESLTEHFGFVVSIFNSTRERAAIFPSTPNLLQWNLADPSAAQGPEAQRLDGYRRLRDQLRTQVETYLAKEGRVALERRPLQAA